MTTFTLTAQKPSDSSRWEKMAEANGNVLQSVEFDKVQAFYFQIPYYLEVFEKDQWVVGYRFYFWNSSRLPSFIRSISNNINFLSEPIIHPDHLERKEVLMEVFFEYLNQVVKQLNPSTGCFSSYYGEGIYELNFKNAIRKQTFFNVAYIPVSKSEEELFNDLHPKHRNVIRKAQKEGLRMVKENNFELFMQMLQTTYKDQPEMAPNYSYVKHCYEKLLEQNIAQIYFTYLGDEPLSGALLFLLGDRAYYAYGGSSNNKMGAGNLLHWEIMLELNKAGFTKYYLGQVAIEDSHIDNVKFTGGISQFKRRFGVVENKGSNEQFIFHPFKVKVWNAMKKLISK